MVLKCMVLANLPGVSATEIYYLASGKLSAGLEQRCLWSAKFWYTGPVMIAAKGFGKKYQGRKKKGDSMESPEVYDTVRVKLTRPAVVVYGVQSSVKLFPAIPLKIQELIRPASLSLLLPRELPQSSGPFISWSEHET